MPGWLDRLLGPKRPKPQPEQPHATLYIFPNGQMAIGVPEPVSDQARLAIRKDVEAWKNGEIVTMVLPWPVKVRYMGALPK